MCILFVFNGSKDDSGDYSLILASNRDEYYDRPTQCIAPWMEDEFVYGGRDLQPGSGSGTWLAVVPTRKKIGVLLNIPGKALENPQSRGKIVADYVRSIQHTKEYVGCIQNYVNECNEFVFVTVEFGNTTQPTISSYSNASNKVTTHTENILGFGNCLPDNPLKKVEAGKYQLGEICARFNKIDQKEQLIENLLLLLKSEVRHLPDLQLQSRKSIGYEYLSSIFVSIPELRYGTRTHTIILITKSGHANVIESTLKEPMDVLNLNWKRTEYNFDLSN